MTGEILEMIKEMTRTITRKKILEHRFKEVNYYIEKKIQLIAMD